MNKTENFDQIEVTSSPELREWLLKNHAQKESIWLVTYKKETTQNSYPFRRFYINCFALDGLMV